VRAARTDDRYDGPGLRRFEPVIRYTTGELFLPMLADDYVAGLYAAGRERRDRTLVAEPGT
jgi:hypothetical protein